MPFPTQYRRVGAAVASYSWTDMASGTGYIIFYGSKGDNGEYIVLPYKTYSEEMCTYTENQVVTTTPTKYFDKDFDITFNLPRDLKGDLITLVPMGVSARSDTPATHKFYCIIKAVHYDGSTETVLGTGTSVETSLTLGKNVAAYAARTHLVKANISSKKHFRAGEILRIIIEGWYYVGGGTSPANLILGHDPMGRTLDYSDAPEEPCSATNPGEIKLANEVSGGGTVTNLTSEMHFQVPFVVDI